MRPIEIDEKPGHFFTTTALYIPCVPINKSCCRFVSQKRNKNVDLDRKRLTDKISHYTDRLAELMATKRKSKVVESAPAISEENAEQDDDDLNMADDEEGGTRIGDIYIPPPVKPYCSTESIGPRLIITKISNCNFKSYAGEVVLGPFSNVSFAKKGMFMMIICANIFSASMLSSVRMAAVRVTLSIPCCSYLVTEPIKFDAKNCPC